MVIKEVINGICLAGLHKNYSITFHKIWWKGSSWATEETTRFW